MPNYNTKYDHDKMLELMKAGKKDREIQEIMGMPNAQTVNLARQKFIKEGMLLPQLGRSQKGRSKGSVAVAEKPKRIKKDGDGLKDLTYDQLETISVNMYKRAMEYPALADEIVRLKNRNASLEEVNKQLERKLMGLTRNRAEFEILKRDGKTFSKDLTEHIDCAPLFFTRAFNINDLTLDKHCDCLNINPYLIRVSL